MKKSIFITIGICALNEEANIGKLLVNLLHQKQKGYVLREIIVISDGSTDSTVQIVRSIRNKFIKLIVHTERKGQNDRQNELIDRMSKSSLALLLLEADWLPVNSMYVSNMISTIPKNRMFGMIKSRSVPYPEVKIWGQIMNAGFYFRKDLFSKAATQSGLYEGFGGRLLSRDFLKSFRWSRDFHEDSYLFRKLLESGLSCISAKNAEIYFRSVSSVSDYFLQSGKYQKASAKENTKSKIYDVKFNLARAALVTMKHILKQPIQLPIYIVFALLSRLYSAFLPKYTIFWKQYKSSKSFSEKSKGYTETVKDCFGHHAAKYDSAFWKNLGREYLSNIETEYIGDHTPQKTHMLDLGIGIGRNAQVLLKHGNTVTGLDISEKMLEETKANLSTFAKARKLFLKTADLNVKLPFSSNSFGGAICIRVIKYVKEWKHLLKEINRVLRKDATFIVEISNKNSVQFFSQNYNLYFTFDEHEFKKALSNAGFEILDKTYGTKLPFFVYNVFNSRAYIRFLSNVEKLLYKLVGGKYSRNIMFTCKKP